MRKGFAQILGLVAGLIVIIVVGIVIYRQVINFQERSVQNDNMLTDSSDTVPSSSTITNNEQFDPSKIEKLIEFYDKDNQVKKIIVLKLDKNYERAIYLTDENVNKNTAKLLLNVGHSDLKNTPSIYPGYVTDTRYIVIDLFGPGDNSDVAIANEEGLLITNSLKKTNPEFKYLLVWFESWADKNTIVVSASSFADDGKGPAEATINLLTGKIIGEFTR